MTSHTPKLPCIYCSTPTKRGQKGEHIIPRVIGGGRTLNEVPNRAVCTKCNSGVLSQLDRELCSRSYLSAIASQEIDAHLWQAWDVDHGSHNLLVEARPAWGADETLKSLRCYPQITFERTGPDVRGDYEEFCEFGQENFTRVLFKAARNCFDRYRRGEKGVLHFERVRSGVVHDDCRLAPRIFVRTSINEVAHNIQKQSFILRFMSQEDKRFALHSLSDLGDGRDINKWSHTPGSHHPTISFFFDAGDTMRALMKMGVNLIAAYCPNTPVDRNSFSSAIRTIMDETQVSPRLLNTNGFVRAQDVQVIKADGNAHSFRLVHIDQMWHIYASFFGGKIGSYVSFRGPNDEHWHCMDIVAPLNAKDWTANSTRILPYMRRPSVVWRDATVVTPSLKLQESVSSTSTELVKKKPARS